MAAPSSPGARDEARVPGDTETDDSWGLGDMPAHRQTDVYLIHEVCWHRLLEHFGPDELHLGSLFEALELLPYTPGQSHHAFTPGGHPSFHSTFEDQEIRRDGRFGLPALEELMRFPRDPPLPASCITPRRRASHRRRTGRDGFQRLPLEIIEAIAILLPTRDILHLRCASRGFVGIFSSRAFWKTRFEINAERGFLLPVLRNYFERKGRRRRQEEEGEIDWRLLYHCTCKLGCSWGFRLEIGTWEALRWVRDTALALHSGRPRPLDFRGMGLHHYDNTLVRGTYREVVEIHAPVCQVAVSVLQETAKPSITGLDFFFKDGSRAMLGYSCPEAREIHGETQWKQMGMPNPYFYPGVRVTIDIESFHGFSVSRDVAGGVTGFLILPGMDYSVGYLDTVKRFAVGDYIEPRPYHPFYSSLDEVYQVTAVSDVGIQPYEQVVDNFWLNVFQNYFPLQGRYGVERESYTNPQGRFTANVLLTRIMGNALQKVVIVEAKRFPRNTLPGWEQRFSWRPLQNQLRDRLTGVRTTSGTQHTLYGIAAVGDRVRFFQLPEDSGQLVPFGLDPQSPPPEARTLSIHRDQNEIDWLIRSIRSIFEQ
ncbi:hypothetical protein ASPACDRAFT_39913 [Aspergillus aculeatus ATCC 16872]|uniref:F-box domain-containing protein n=1 Tax=Aspergillus aculeatus (strain ATCC 16872 / CBS 172.66 / WB 5094) TaxID=690307 RepID=A0A1L9X2J2_ASPA1|nr:uncharacterized protein ASPACDRAFT_39913 [Aspergillus aculeatus ATCC 16872]OJK02606.1 hypothetical protein ASPACDRAFT_39913 [Aspergillus aculeatus ATCC 16872]